MPKDPKTSGFPVIEMLLVALVFITLVDGYFAFSHSQSGKTTVPPAGWLTYKSSHNSIQFIYPKTWQLKQIPLSGQPNYYLEDVSFTGPNNFSLDFTLEKTHIRPNQVWACQYPPMQEDFPINSQYKMVLSGRSGITLLATDSKGSIPDDFGCGSLINTLGPNKLFKFSGGYTTASTTSTQSIEAFANQPEVQTAKAIFSSLKR